MNTLQKASESIKSSNLSVVEASTMAIAMIIALVLQTHTQTPNTQLPVGLEQNLSFLTGCGTSEMTISRQLSR